MAPLYFLQHRVLPQYILDLTTENLRGILWHKNQHLAEYIMNLAAKAALSDEEQAALRWQAYFMKIGAKTALVYKFQPLGANEFEPTECPYVVILADTQAYYFTIEQSLHVPYTLCGWDTEKHMNFGCFTDSLDEVFARITEIVGGNDQQKVFATDLQLIGEELDAWKDKQDRISADDIMVELLYAKLTLEKEDYAGFQYVFSNLLRTKQLLMIWSTPKLRFNYVTSLADDAIEYVEKNKQMLKTEALQAVEDEISAVRAHLATLSNPATQHTDEEYLALANGVEEVSVGLLKVVELLSEKE
jgi:hypothetical protein